MLGLKDTFRTLNISCTVGKDTSEKCAEGFLYLGKWIQCGELAYLPIRWYMRAEEDEGRRHDYLLTFMVMLDFVCKHKTYPCKNLFSIVNKKLILA